MLFLPSCLNMEMTEMLNEKTKGMHPASKQIIRYVQLFVHNCSIQARKKIQALSINNIEQYLEIQNLPFFQTVSA